MSAGRPSQAPVPPRLADVLPRRLFLALQERLIYRPRMKGLGITRDRTPMFNSVFLETRTRCNGTCSFCAASIRTETRPDVSMSRDVYRRIIEELSALSFAGIFAPYVNSDPLLHADLDDLLRLARRELPRAWLQIVTNGKALTVERARRLVDAGLDELHVNHYDDDFSAPLPARLRAIRDDLLPSLVPAGRLRIGTDPPLSEAGPRGLFVFNLVRRRENEVLTSRGGTAPNAPTPTGPPRGFCEYPFTQLNITADGRVGQCCCDFHFSSGMGNVRDASLVEIWHGAAFRRLRAALLRGDRSANPLCRQCDFCGVKTRPAPVARALGWYRALGESVGGIRNALRARVH